VIANHAAVHNLDNDTVAAAIAPFTGYLATPDVTVYLHTSPTELTRRMSAKPDQNRSDRDLLDDTGLLRRLQDRYDQIAAADPTARHLQTTRHTPGELTDRIMAMLPAFIASG
jgi:dTMP kinase